MLQLKRWRFCSRLHPTRRRGGRVGDYHCDQNAIPFLLESPVQRCLALAADLHLDPRIFSLFANFSRAIAHSRSLRV